MRGSQPLGWFFVIAGGWFLLSGLVANDMGGLVGLGYNPDVPLSLSRAPFRFILGVLLYGAVVAGGIVMIVRARRGDFD